MNYTTFLIRTNELNIIIVVIINTFIIHLKFELYRHSAYSHIPQCTSAAELTINTHMDVNVIKL